APPAPAPPSDLGVVPIGDEVGPTPALPPPILSEPASQRPEWPLLRRSGNPASGAMPSPLAPPAATGSSAAPAGSGSEPGAAPRSNSSVIMSKPTTLRGLIEKVSIESPISPAFRSPGGVESAAPADPANEAHTPASPTLGTSPTASPVRPQS